jgi:hypothetical protein
MTFGHKGHFLKNNNSSFHKSMDKFLLYSKLLHNIGSMSIDPPLQGIQKNNTHR